MAPVQLAFVAVNVLLSLFQVGLVALVLAGRRAAVNLALAWYLLILVGNSVTTAIQLGTHDAFLWANSEAYGMVTSVLTIPAYLVFVGLAIPSPAVRWLRRPAAIALLLAAGAVAAVALFVAPAPFLVGPRGSDSGYIGPDAFPLGPVAASYSAPLAILAFGSVALATIGAFDAWRRAPPGSLTRRRARAYLFAFLCNDAALATGFSYIFGLPYTTFLYVGYVGSSLLGIAFAALLARALLRDQLFDLDLRLKLNIKRGTVVAIFAAVFVIVAQVASNYLQGTYGWLVGGVAAGALLLALRPIERAAQRVADHAMPRVQQTPAYVAFRKMEVYKAALEEVAADGTMSEKDRRVLERLRAQLGLTAEDARAMENDLMASARAPGVG